MKYIKLFNQHTDYESYIDSSVKILPNMSYCKDIKDKHLTKFSRYINVYGDYNNTTLNSSYEIRNYVKFENNFDVNAGYAIKDISIFMNNENITSEVYNNNEIYIPHVIGDVSINIETDSSINKSMFINRITGAGADIQNNKALLKSIKGNSIIWRQLWKNSSATKSQTGCSATYNYTDDEAIITITDCSTAATSAYAGIYIYYGANTNKYMYYSADIYIETDTTANYGRFGMGYGSSNSVKPDSTVDRVKNKWFSFSNIYKLSGSDTIFVLNIFNTNSWFNTGETHIVHIKNIRIINLTATFGSGYEPTLTVFNNLYPLRYNTYNSASILLNNNMTNYISKHCDANTGINPRIISTSANIWKIIENTKITPSDGIFNLTFGTYASNVYNGIRVNPNTTSGHIYYSRCYIKSLYGKGYITNYGGSQERQFYTLQHNGTWEKISRRHTSYTRIDFGVWEGINGESFQIKLPLVIDLTLLFGAGKEPTLEYCNMIFDNFQYDFNATNFDTWNLIQNVNIPINELTGKLNENVESTVIFPNGMKSAHLPYTAQVEYIQKTSNTNNYFYTDFIPTGTDITIKIKFNTQGWINDNNYLLAFGTPNSDSIDCYNIRKGATNSNRYYIKCGATNVVTGSLTGTIAYNIDINMTISDGQMTVNGTTTTLGTTRGTINTEPFRLLDKIKAKLYYCKIYKGNNLVVDIIPVKINSNGALYDKISQKLLSEYKPDGEEYTPFTAGPVVTSEMSLYDEIKKDSDGLWKAYKLFDTSRLTNTITGIGEYVKLDEPEIYILDNQDISEELLVSNQGNESILPLNTSIPTTAPTIMEIQYGIINS